MESIFAVGALESSAKPAVSQTFQQTDFSQILSAGVQQVNQDLQLAEQTFSTLR